MSNNDSSNQKLEILAKKVLPDFLKGETPQFVAFIEAYYEWLDQTDQVNKVMQSFPDTIDINRTVDDFVKYFHNEFMIDIPRSLLTNKRLLLKYINDFHRAKGSEKAYSLLFRILYGEDNITFYYPGQDILRASDGKWIVERSLKILFSGNNTSGLENKILTGQTSGAVARVERIEQYNDNGSQVTEVFVSNVEGGPFVANELVSDGTNSYTVETYTVYDGKYVGTDGFLSWDKYLQDNFYYQEFSYELRLSRAIEQWRDVVLNVIHPTGLIVFGSVLIEEELDVNADGFSTGDMFDILTIIPEKEFWSNSYGAITTSMVSGTELIKEKEIIYDTAATVEEEVVLWTGPANGTISTGGSNTTISFYAADQIDTIDQSSIGGLGDSSTINGNNTTFTTHLTSNDNIIIIDTEGGRTLHTILGVSSNTLMTLTRPYGATLENGTYLRTV